MIYTVFFTNSNEMPQDFRTYSEADEYGKYVGEEYVIQSTDGELV